MDVKVPELVDLSLPPEAPILVLLLYTDLDNELHLLPIHRVLADELQVIEHLLLEVDLNHDLEHEGWHAIIEVMLHLREFEADRHKK